MSGLPDIGNINAQVGQGRLAWARLEGWDADRSPCFETPRYARLLSMRSVWAARANPRRFRAPS